MMWQLDWSSILCGHPLEWIIIGFFTTLLVTLVGSLLATLMMILLLVLRFMAGRIGSILVIIWVSLFRNTPLLIQLFFWYFAAWSTLPISWRNFLIEEHAWAILPGNIVWLTPEFFCSAWGLAMFSAAYLLEELQSGLNAVPNGQSEAAISQGFNSWQTLYNILLPQGLRNAWQPLVGQYLNLMKLSSLASTIGLGELTYQISQIESFNAHALEGFALGTLLYLLLGLVIGGILLLFNPSYQQFRR